jgi:hypothetical protein
VQRQDSVRRKEAAKSGNVRRPSRATFVPLPPRRLPSVQDNKVIEQLTTAPSGTLDEWSGFAARSSGARLEITEIAMALEKSLQTEKQKPSAKGERKKRLRILVEALADWWANATGKTIAPYVQSKPLGNHRAFVAGRRGRFVEFSLSVLSRLDGFKESEVISAIINVYERQRRGQSRRWAAKKS